jgi:hypothetical protein
LENDLEFSSAERAADQLVTVTILLVSSNLEVREKALDGFVKSDSMFEKLVAFEIVFEVRRGESVPVNHALFYRYSALAQLAARSAGCVFDGGKPPRSAFRLLLSAFRTPHSALGSPLSLHNRWSASLFLGVICGPWK